MCFATAHSDFYHTRRIGARNKEKHRSQLAVETKAPHALEMTVQFGAKPAPIPVAPKKEHPLGPEVTLKIKSTLYLLTASLQHLSWFNLLVGL